MGHLMNFFKPVENLSAGELRTWLEERDAGEHIVLDVRTAREYEEGHIPGATFIPLAELEARAGELDHNLPIVAYCKVGGRSRSAAALLGTLGFGATYTVPGGIKAWNGLVADGPPEAGMADFDPALGAKQLTAAAWRLECGSGRFYTELVQRVEDNGFQDLLSSLASAEEHHKNGLSDLYSELGGDGTELARIADACGIMEGGINVDEGLAWAANRPRDEVVEFVMGLETNALDLYLKVLQRVRTDPAKKVFSQLADEEREHLRRLGALLAEAA